MVTISFEIPDGVLKAMSLSPEEFVREMRIAAATAWFKQGKISREIAAEFAGLDGNEFTLILSCMS